MLTTPIVRLSTQHLLALAAAVYALVLAALLSILIAGALAVPPATSAVCMAGGKNCHKVEIRS